MLMPYEQRENSTKEVYTDSAPEKKCFIGFKKAFDVALYFNYGGPILIQVYAGFPSLSLKFSLCISQIAVLS